MTRQEIQASGLRRARHILEVAGKGHELFPGFDDPWLMDDYTNDTASRLYRAGSDLYLKMTRDIVADTAQYPRPQALEIEDAILTSSDGTITHLLIVTAEQMLGLDPNWRVAVSSGPATYLIDLGDTFELWPVPDFDQASGLSLFGVGVLNHADWAGKNDDCPLLLEFHPTIAKGLAVMLAGSAIETPLSRTMATQFMREKGHFESQNATLTSARKNRNSGMTGYRTDLYGNPLNL